MKLPDITSTLSLPGSPDGDQARALARQAEGAANRPSTDREGLSQVAKQFEALFYGQLLKSMRSTIPENQFWGQSSGTKIYRQLHDQELATRLADQGGLGIADLIERQFEGAVAREGGDAAVDHTSVLRQRGLAAYRQIQGPQADVVRLRQMARAVGGAAADTLSRFEDDLVAAARETGLEPGLVLAVAVRESAGDPSAVSPAGALGLMQLMPATAREVGVADPHDPAQNLRGGARYLSRMLDRYDGDMELALAAYNAGPGNVDRTGRAVPNFPETQDYVTAVQDLARRLGIKDGTNLDRSSGNDGDPGSAQGPQQR